MSHQLASPQPEPASSLSATRPATLVRVTLLLVAALALSLLPVEAEGQPRRKGRPATDPGDLMQPQIREPRTPPKSERRSKGDANGTAHTDASGGVDPSDPIADAQPADRSRWQLQRRAEFEVDQQRNHRLDADRPSRRSDVEPMLRLGATWRSSDHLLGFIETEILVRRRSERGEPTGTDAALRINQAYFALADAIADTELRLGRWLYRDEREWLFDESIDGLFASHDVRPFEINALAGRVNHFRRDLLDSSTRGDPINVFGVLARATVRPRFEVGAYAVVSHDTAGAAGQQRNLGLRAHGMLGNWLHWTELAWVDGQVGGRRISGQAVDIGGVYQLPTLPLKPRLMLGYAWGSGDDSPDGSTDRRFRQTSLQGNEARLGGLYKRRIYGEVMNPELSNLRVLSAGVGMTPVPQWSVDLIWYGYRQDTIGPVEHAAVRGRPDSRDRLQLGNEVNLVLGYAPTDAIIVGAVLGLHQPSGRFERDARGREHDPGLAAYGGLEVRVRF